MELRTRVMEQNKLGAIHKEGKNMRYITKIYSTAIMMMAAVIIACSGGSETIEDVKPVTPDTPKTLNKYTFTVNASKSAGKSNTRALSLDGNTLNSSWATSEHIYVKKGSTWATGALQPQSNEANAQLSGTLSDITINAGDDLTLQFPRQDIDYTGQIGTIEDIAAKYDYATATARVTGVSDGNISANPVSFDNQQAIVKFTLNKYNGEAIDLTSLTISSANNKIVQSIAEPSGTIQYGSITITPTEATNEVFVAIRQSEADDITLTASDGTYTYLFTKENMLFDAGKYYSVTVKMERVVDVSSFDFNAELMNGDILTGTDNDSNHGIYLPWGYPYTEITFMDMNFKGEFWNNFTCETRINIKGHNELNNLSSLGDLSGSSCSLILKGDGTLQLSGGLNVHHSVLTIENGTIDVKGSGINIFCGEVDIKGGIVTTIPSFDNTCGIGIGYMGSIEISGGSVTATGTSSHAGIGTVQHVNGSFIYDPESETGTDPQHIYATINISGGTVNASGGSNAAGIGSSAGGEGVNNNIYLSINISGGEVVATGGINACGIGYGYQSSCDDISITGESTRVTSTKGEGSEYNIDAFSVKIGNISGSIKDSPYIYPE